MLQIEFGGPPKGFWALRIASGGSPEALRGLRIGFGGPPKGFWALRIASGGSPEALGRLQIGFGGSPRWIRTVEIGFGGSKGPFEATATASRPGDPPSKVWRGGLRFVDRSESIAAAERTSLVGTPPEGLPAM
ncbi:MAG: hypothetical protein U0441_09525 [Polyangiaceae bacterium]